MHCRSELDWLAPYEPRLVRVCMELFGLVLLPTFHVPHELVFQFGDIVCSIRAVRISCGSVVLTSLVCAAFLILVAALYELHDLVCFRLTDSHALCEVSCSHITINRLLRVVWTCLVPFFWALCALYERVSSRLTDGLVWVVWACTISSYSPPCATPCIKWFGPVSMTSRYALCGLILSNWHPCVRSVILFRSVLRTSLEYAASNCLVPPQWWPYTCCVFSPLYWYSCMRLINLLYALYALYEFLSAFLAVLWRFYVFVDSVYSRAAACLTPCGVWSFFLTASEQLCVRCMSSGASF